LLPVGLLLVRPFEYTYRQVVPSTWVAAEKTLRARLAPLQIRHVAYEPAAARLRLSATWRLPVITAVPSLAALSPAQLDLMDAELLPLSRTQGPEAAFYRDRRQRLAGEGVLEIHARPFRSRGMPLLLLLHPWTPIGKAVPLEVERSADPTADLVARLPGPLAAGDVLSIELMLPVSQQAAAVLLEPGGQSLPLHYAGRRRQKIRFLTPRFPYSAGAAGIRIPGSASADPQSFRLQLWRWTKRPTRT